MTYTNTYAGVDGITLLASDANDQFNLIEAAFAEILGGSDATNAAYGTGALAVNTTGENNVAIGVNALAANDDGHDNVAIGFGALAANIGGWNNIGIGAGVMPVAAFTAFDGIGNIGIGADCLASIVSGDSNIVMGTAASALTVGTGNIVIGQTAMNAATGGSNNTIVGTAACDSGAGTGSGNTFVGRFAGRTNIASNIVGVGISALAANTSGTNNVAVGPSAGSINTTGSNHVSIGASAGPATNALANTIAIGQGVSVATSNYSQIGNASQVQMYMPGRVVCDSGSSGSAANTLIGMLHANTTAVGNVGGGTDDLMTYSLLANSLSANNKGLRVTCWGVTAANANAKTVTINFGSTVCATFALATGSAHAWRLTLEIFRSGSGAQVYSVTGLNGNMAGSITPGVAQGTSAESDSGAITIKCTGAATADNDIIQKCMFVEFFN